MGNRDSDTDSDLCLVLSLLLPCCLGPLVAPLNSNESPFGFHLTMVSPCVCVVCVCVRVSELNLVTHNWFFLHTYVHTHLAVIVVQSWWQQRQQQLQLWQQQSRVVGATWSWRRFVTLCKTRFVICGWNNAIKLTLSEVPYSQLPLSLYPSSSPLLTLFYASCATCWHCCCSCSSISIWPGHATFHHRRTISIVWLYQVCV